MSVELDPLELGFRRPFTTEVSETLHLRNSNSTPVAFKVKTTAPKQYCVRPNSGRIEPGGTVEVQVLLQAMKEDPPLEAKCRDKFLVQSVSIGADKEIANVAQIWSNIEQTAKSSIQEKKIRVNFLPADGSAPAATPSRKSLGASQDYDEPPAYSSPASVMATPAAVRSDSKDVKSSGGASANGAQSAVAGAAASVGAVAATSAEELKVQLQAAQAQIAKLTRQAADQTGLRQRKVGDSAGAADGTTSTSLAPQTAPGGVPVSITFLLCLLSFLLAYLLF